MKLQGAALIKIIPILAAVLLGAPAVGLAKDPVNTDFSGVAVKGYDPVAYIMEAKPVKGKAKFKRNGKKISRGTYKRLTGTGPAY